jgi:hypothetical protein
MPMKKMHPKLIRKMDKEFICREIILPISKNPTKVELDSLKAIALTLQNDL